MVNVDVEV